MSEKQTKNDIVYQARLHYIVFLWPIILLLMDIGLGYYGHAPYQVVMALGAIAVIWEGIMSLTYHYSFLNIKENRIVLCSGIIVRQTVDIPLNKIESIDIRQSIMGSLFQYGTLIITGTGGSRQFVNYLSKPLTCRRYIEDLMYDTK